MADGKRRKPATSGRGPFPIEDGLAPLEREPPRERSGRIRSLGEARVALGLPKSSTDDVLQASGRPPDSRLVAYPVSDPAEPHRVAEYAMLRVFTRKGRDLVPPRPAFA